MDQNNKDENIGRWVNDRLATLSAGVSWSSDSSRVFERLKERKESNAKRRHVRAYADSRLWMTAAVSVVIVFVFAALPWRQLKNVVVRSEKGPAAKVVEPAEQLAREFSVEPAETPKKARVAARPVVPAPAVSESPVQGATAPPPSPPQTPGPRATPPRVLKQTEPIYTDEARMAHIQGTVILGVVVHKDGTATVIRIVRGLGYGLDENAKAIIEKWEFEPGKVNGQPVDVELQISVGFHLY
ncbi:MAG TPA: TonB family protein [Terriglobia bacterium]|nr:TonB family protein [Terriglobia bacterium]